MRKILLYAVSLLLIFAGCKKNIEIVSKGSPDLLETQVRNYVKATSIKFNGLALEKINQTLSDIDFSNVERKKLNDASDIIIAPLKNTDVKDFIQKKPGKNQVRVSSAGAVTDQNTFSDQTVTKVVFIIQGDEIQSGDIVAISSKTKKEEIEQLFVSILSVTKKDFTGNININSLARRPIKNWGFTKGHLSSTEGYKNRTKNSNTDNARQLNTVECFDRFLVTDHYDLYGNLVGSEEEYLFTWCRGEGETVDFIEPPIVGGAGPYADTLCAQNQRFAENLAYKEIMQLLKDSLATNREVGYTMKKNSDGSLTFIKLPPNGNGGVSVPNSLPPSDGMFHSHFDAPGIQTIFTPTDLQTFYLNIYYVGRTIDPTTFQLGVMVPGGKLLLLRIEDENTFAYWGYQNLVGVSNTVYNSNFYDVFSNTTGDAKLAAFRSSLSGSGLALYEMDMNDWNAGFKKIEPPPAGSNATLRRVHCK